MKNVLKRSISILACMAILISTMSMYVFAATDVLYVGGYSVNVTSGETVVCGEGTAVYDSGAKTLTLTDATINTSYSSNYSAIYTNMDIEIILVGENAITSNNNIRRGINVYGDLKISGTGSLDITVAYTSSTSYGIYATGDLSIEDVTLNLYDVNTASSRKGVAIVCYNNNGIFEITNATITADGFVGVLQGYWSTLEATNSAIIGTGDYLQTGIAVNGTGNGDGSAKLVGCTVDFTVSQGSEWDLGTGITTGGTYIILDNTKFTFNSEIEYVTALYSYNSSDWSGTVDIINESEVEINIVNEDSYSSAIFTGDYINIDNSKVSVISNATAIYSDNAAVTIANGSEVYAESIVATPILGNWGDVIITDSELTAVGHDYMAIDTSYDLIIKNSVVNATTVTDCAIFNYQGSIVIENSQVTATSETHSAIYSYKGTIEIIGNDSVVTANAAEGYQAICVYTYSTDQVNAPTDAITITMDDESYIDIIDGVLVSSAYGSTSGTFKGYMTSFVADEDTELGFDKSNALSNVTIQIKDADYTAVDEAIDAANALTATDYTDFTAVQAAIDAVIEGYTIAYQDDVDAMAAAILAAIDDLELVPDENVDTDADDDIPDTGDNSNVMVFIALLALSACTATYAISRKRA